MENKYIELFLSNMYKMVVESHTVDGEHIHIEFDNGDDIDIDHFLLDCMVEGYKETHSCYTKDGVELYYYNFGDDELFYTATQTDDLGRLLEIGGAIHKRFSVGM